MSSVFRNFAHSSINSAGHYLDKWLNNNQCVLCFKPIAGRPWCDACTNDLPWRQKVNLPNIPFVDSATASFLYNYPINRLIQAGKYGGKYSLITALAVLMPEITNAGEGTVIYPVPVSAWRLFRRGFNQSSVIAREITRIDRLPISEVSIHKRIGRTDQSKLDAAHRRLNARSLFYARKFEAAEHAVIIDDVITTGATVSTMAKILRENGAKRIDVYALAAVPK